jgi:hypothetical protein
MVAAAVGGMFTSMVAAAKFCGLFYVFFSAAIGGTHHVFMVAAAESALRL